MGLCGWTAGSALRVGGDADALVVCPAFSLELVVPRMFLCSMRDLSAADRAHEEGARGLALRWAAGPLFWVSSLLREARWRLYQSISPGFPSPLGFPRPLWVADLRLEGKFLTKYS